MDWNNRWDAQRDLPLPQHWFTGAVRALAIITAVGGGIGSIVEQNILPVAIGVGTFISCWATALVVDGVLVQSRIQAAWFARYAAEIDRLERRHREQDEREKQPDVLDEAMAEIQEAR